MEDYNRKIRSACVGIAGLGGLGSTVAAALARAGVGRLVVADFDAVEAGNLNRQHYFVDQVGAGKVEATVENLGRINPAVEVEGCEVVLDGDNICEIFAGVDVVAECFDAAAAKQMICETVLTRMAGKYLVAASGMAGYGRSNEVVTRRVSERFVIVGDGKSGIETEPFLTAGRVWLVASHQANAILEIIIDEIRR